MSSKKRALDLDLVYDLGKLNETNLVSSNNQTSREQSQRRYKEQKLGNMSNRQPQERQSLRIHPNNLGGNVQHSNNMNNQFHKNDLKLGQQLHTKKVFLSNEKKNKNPLLQNQTSLDPNMKVLKSPKFPNSNIQKKSQPIETMAFNLQKVPSFGEREKNSDHSNYFQSSKTIKSKKHFKSSKKQKQKRRKSQILGRKSAINMIPRSEINEQNNQDNLVYCVALKRNPSGKVLIKQSEIKSLSSSNQIFKPVFCDSNLKNKPNQFRPIKHVNKQMGRSLTNSMNPKNQKKVNFMKEMGGTAGVRLVQVPSSQILTDMYLPSDTDDQINLIYLDPNQKFRVSY